MRAVAYFCPSRTCLYKNDPKIKSTSKFKTEETLGNEHCSTTLVDPKKLFEPYPGPKNSPLGP